MKPTIDCEAIQDQLPAYIDCRHAYGVRTVNTQYPLIAQHLHCCAKCTEVVYISLGIVVMMEERGLVSPLNQGMREVTKMSEEELIELLADKEHASWASWMTYLFSKCRKTNNGSLVIEVDYVMALQGQIDTPYAQLLEKEKQYDRDEVAHILPIIQRWKNS